MPVSDKKNTVDQRVNDWVKLHISRISPMDKIFFLDHMRTMLHAGLSLMEALQVLSKETENFKLSIVIQKIQDDVEKGTQLSETLQKFPKVFPPIYVKMIEAGEISGKLEETLGYIVLQMKKNQALTSTIRGAMIYPSVIIVAISVVAILMVTVVLPKLMVLFKDFDAELPLATRVLIAVTDFMSKPLNLILSLSTIVVLIILFVYSLKKSPSFRASIHKMNLHLPIAGNIIKHINLARFSLTLSSLLKSTIPIVEAIDITAETCSNLTYTHILHASTEKVKQGTPLSETLVEHHALFPPMVTEMIMVGEKTGEVDRLLAELADFYSEEVDKTMKNFSTIIEPVIIILLGLTVAGIATAVISPMYSLIQNF
jgi:type IV pilus assembly protein PilC